MRRLIIGVVFFTFSWTSLAQSKVELGFFGGTGYYLGDLNPVNQFYSTSLAMGGICRYSFNNHYSLRANMIFSELNAADLDFDNLFQQNRRAYFATEVVDVSLQVEFNFQPYWSPKKMRTKYLTPYITGGIAFVAPVNDKITPAIPMGLGIKFNPTGRWTSALEWSFQKSFSDSFDKLDNTELFPERAKTHNNDWVSFFGIIISYKLFPGKEGCYW